MRSVDRPASSRPRICPTRSTALAELRAYLDGSHPRVHAVPGEGARPAIHLLGSGTYSAALAARLGLPFVIAGHFAPGGLQETMDLYHADFRPSDTLPEPYAIACVNLVLADDEREARRLFTSIQQRFLGHLRGVSQLLPRPVDDIGPLWTAREAAAVDQQLAASYLGTLETVRPRLEELVARTGVRELLLATETHDPEARKHSIAMASALWS
ncbi:LLM class flavin-dependent oxidoreductase [Streptomyces sp. NPDC051569]|uniref:LLM class flavin-dependent oxidoreductase n=1 Tax=Streptomyces sp. NPDC051569 TaxID=3365661 RepID=UPI0037ACD0C9